jgi:hypothetical protein
MAEARPAFPYTAPTRYLVKWLVLSGAVAVWQAILLVKSQDGFVTFQFFGIPTGNDTLPIGIAFLCNLAGAAVIGLAWVRRTSSTRRLEFHDSYLLAPASRWLLSTYEQVIAYKSVSKLQVVKSGRKRVLRVHHRDGRLDVQEELMSSSGDFDSFHALLADQVARRVEGPR